MSGQFYDGGKLSRTYLFPSADIASAAIFGRIALPEMERCGPSSRGSPLPGRDLRCG